MFLLKKVDGSLFVSRIRSDTPRMHVMDIDFREVPLLDNL